MALTLGHNSPGRVESSSNVGMVPGLSGYDSYEHTPRNDSGRSSGGDSPVGSLGNLRAGVPAVGV